MRRAKITRTETFDRAAASSDENPALAGTDFMLLVVEAHRTRRMGTSSKWILD
jgi:hypothetical protein